MGNLEFTLNKRLRDLGLKKQVDAAMVVAEAQKSIEKVFGERGNENLKVVSFKKGVLKIAAKNSAWATECQGNITKIKIPPVERVVFTNQINNDFS